jgi:DNA-binding transcriptional regulator YiaG
MTLTQFAAQLNAVLEENNRLRAQVAEFKSKPLDNKRKLSAREVRDIRAAHRNGMSQKDLADSYEVNPATISRTVRGLYHA